MIGAWLESLMGWGYSVIAFVQKAEHPLLTGFFKSITFFGNEGGYLLLLPLVYWALHDRVGRRLGFVLFTAVAINSLLKAAFGIPRPVAGWIQVLVHEPTPSFPSGHAMGTLAVWGYIASQWKLRPAQISIGILIFLVGFSRIYLGAHFPQDILGGWLFSGIFLLLFLRLEPRLTPKLQELPLPQLLLIACAAPLALVSIHWIPGAVATSAPNTAAAIKQLITVCGTMLGFGIGAIFERRHVGFSSDGTPKHKLLRLLVGLLPVALVYVGLKLVFPDGLLFRFVRYACVGLVAGWIAPWLFVRMKLSEPHTATHATT